MTSASGGSLQFCRLVVKPTSTFSWWIPGSPSSPKVQAFLEGQRRQAGRHRVDPGGISRPREGEAREQEPGAGGKVFPSRTGGERTPGLRPRSREPSSFTSSASVASACSMGALVSREGFLVPGNVCLQVSA
jgi:hypothetical protein